jgi:hypothetical protein
MKKLILAAVACLALAITGTAAGGTPGADVRLTNDCVVPATPDPVPTGASSSYVEPAGCPPGTVVAGYVSSYTIGTGQPYTDDVLDECSIAHGRQNEPAIEVDPRNTSVLVGSSNDYCGVYAGRTSSGTPIATGPIWLGYYRSEDSGASFVSSLVPGYPGDASPFAPFAHVRTASAGDPVIAWDAQGRVFIGAESSDDPAGTKKTFGDTWVARYVNPNGPGGATADDGRLYEGSELVARGSSAPNLLGKFNDKTAIQADHNSDGRCDNDVYFSYARFTGNGGNGIYFSRSTDHGASFTQLRKLSVGVHDSQFPDISVTGSSNVYVTWREYASQGNQPDQILYVRSTDCGATFSPPRVVTTFVRYDAVDVVDPEAQPIPQAAPDDPFAEESDAQSSLTVECGDFASHCQSGYTFFRRDTQVRSTGNQFAGPTDETVYMVYDPTIPGTETPTGTTYGSIQPGTGSQSGVYFLELNGATGSITAGPTLVDPTDYTAHQGMQLFPDIAADTPSGATVLHTIWWDSRNDPYYSPKRPVGNNDHGLTAPSLDAYGAASTDGGATWTPARLSDVTSNPNYEQFTDRTVPFAGDYLWVTGLGTFSYGTWTDWRDTVQGVDPREATEDEDNTTADAYQCRAIQQVPGPKKNGPPTNAWTSDLCPHSGGLDQNIYGDQTP